MISVELCTTHIRLSTEDFLFLFSCSCFYVLLSRIVSCYIKSEIYIYSNAFSGTFDFLITTDRST